MPSRLAPPGPDEDYSEGCIDVLSDGCAKMPLSPKIDKDKQHGERRRPQLAARREGRQEERQLGLMALVSRELLPLPLQPQEGRPRPMGRRTIQRFARRAAHDRQVN